VGGRGGGVCAAGKEMGGVPPGFYVRGRQRLGGGELPVPAEVGFGRGVGGRWGRYGTGGPIELPPGKKVGRELGRWPGRRRAGVGAGGREEGGWEFGPGGAVPYR
jgi:hypothetical protein